ncbi:SRPBCC family protein [Naasia sp. SYSU D00948]|uniref:SRPBCC family protein n=1 Tax=Naasia sp. SYSU D00948 TaxID=2817379 RepID=UPI001B30AA27|nr:SRPBCC family protein [Naasia sp. SYSU D00948]
MTKVEHRILVNVPVSVAYNQWTQFEDFPHFMNGIKKVTQLSDDRLEWVADIAGVRRKWEAKILEQIPDKKVSWAATEGATNAGEVTFEDLGGGQTSVRLILEYEPEGLVEKIGDKLNVVERQTKNDLERFKELIEAEGYASGAWRGTIEGVPGTPGVEEADASRGDSGKAGVSGKVVAAGVAAAAAAVGVAAAATGKKSEDAEVVETDVELTTPVDTVTVAEEDITGAAGTPGSVDEPLMTDVRDPDVDPTLRGDSPDRY